MFTADKSFLRNPEIIITWDVIINSDVKNNTTHD